MGKRLIVFAAVFIFAFGILFASIMQSSSVRYAFSQSPSDIPSSVPDIDYFLPGTGLIGPDDLLWELEVLRDKVWLTATQDSFNKSEILLLLADKRISYAQQLAARDNYSEAIEVAEKAEMYLDDAYKTLRSDNVTMDDCRDYCRELSLSALKHRELLEKMYSTAPDDARPWISEITNTSKNVYEHMTHLMNELGLSPVANPFGN